ncbi:MAG: TMEM14 family protein [Synechococcales bacterium]|nr:TMEM14 family protein [Synechococcales bacterium]
MRCLHSLPHLAFGVSLGCLSLSAIFSFSQTVQANTIAPGSSAATATAMGWEFDGRQTLNLVSLRETQYVGDCPGQDTETVEARFTSSNVPPAPGRRVMIRNVTRGVGSDPFPFTDREYEKGRASEATKMEFGSKHSSKRLRVLPGENQFEYEIRQDGRVIDSGSFVATLEKRYQEIRRNAEWREEEVCANSSVSNNVCADLRQRRQLRCADGRVLQSYMEPDDRTYRTIISNQTHKDISFTIDGRIYHLDPGESTRFRRSSSFNLRYNATCGTCAPTHSNNVTAGKRIKFTRRGSNIRVEDDPRNEW